MLYSLAQIQKYYSGNKSIEILDSVDSTNNEMKRRLRSQEDCPDILLAHGQTHGRGRQGKDFFSPMNAGIYFSMQIPAPSDSQIVYITAKAAVAVCRAIRKITHLDVTIKWVNDIYLSDKKVCGILCESFQADPGVVSNVILGIGINICASSFPDSVPNPGILGCSDLCSSLIGEIILQLESLLSDSGLSFLEDYRRCSYVLNKEISFIENGRQFFGTAKEINDRGYLLVLMQNGEKKLLSSGEISVRLKNL